jgi:hypothetical protein
VAEPAVPRRPEKDQKTSPVAIDSPRGECDSQQARAAGRSSLHLWHVGGRFAGRSARIFRAPQHRPSGRVLRRQRTGIHVSELVILFSDRTRCLLHSFIGNVCRDWFGLRVQGHRPGCRRLQRRRRRRHMQHHRPLLHGERFRFGMPQRERHMPGAQRRRRVLDPRSHVYGSRVRC